MQFTEEGITKEHFGTFITADLDGSRLKNDYIVIPGTHLLKVLFRLLGKMGKSND